MTRYAVLVLLISLMAGLAACGGIMVEPCTATPGRSIGPCAIGGSKDTP